MKKNKFNKEEQNLFAGGGFIPPYGVPGAMPYAAPMDLLTYDYLTNKELGKIKSAQNKQKANANVNAGVSSKIFSDGGSLFDGEPLTYTQEEVDSIVRANTAKGRKERLKKAMESKFAYGGLMNDSPTLLNAMPRNIKAIGGVVQTNSSRFRYKVGQVLDVTEEEAERLKAMGYEFTIVGQ